MNNYRGFTRQFPKIREVGPSEQLAKVLEETAELRDAVCSDEPTWRVAEEAMDVLHATETFLLALERENGADLDAVKEAVVRKNRARGYYESLPVECAWCKDEGVVRTQTVIGRHGTECVVRCCRCKAQTGVFETADEAVNAWNEMMWRAAE